MEGAALLPKFKSLLWLQIELVARLDVVQIVGVVQRLKQSLVAGVADALAVGDAVGSLVLDNLMRQDRIAGSTNGRSLGRGQQQLAAGQDMILDGRDICTTVLPDAPVKIFLTASPEERARRRGKEMREKGHEEPFEAVLAQVRANPGVEKGEYCLAVDISMLPPVEAPAQRPEAAAFMLARMLDGAALREAAAQAAQAGYARNEIYRAKLRISEMFEEE